jgi:hypothetical protein
MRRRPTVQRSAHGWHKTCLFMGETRVEAPQGLYAAYARFKRLQGDFDAAIRRRWRLPAANRCRTNVIHPLQGNLNVHSHFIIDSRAGDSRRLRSFTWRPQERRFARIPVRFEQHQQYRFDQQYGCPTAGGQHAESVRQPAEFVGTGHRHPAAADFAVWSGTVARLDPDPKRSADHDRFEDQLDRLVEGGLASRISAAGAAAARGGIRGDDDCPVTIAVQLPLMTGVAHSAQLSLSHSPYSTAAGGWLR